MRYGWDATRANNVYFFTVGYKYFYINLPDNKKLSMTQLNFLLQELDKIDKYNNEEENENKKVCLSIFGNHFDNIDCSNIATVKKELKKLVTKEVFIEEEKIIGKTLMPQQIKDNLLFHIELEECTNISMLTAAIFNCSKYYYDSYYKAIFSEIFPNYPKVIRLMDIINTLDIKDEKIENVTFENIENLLIDTIKKVFNKLKSYNELISFIKTINSIMREDEIEEIFPVFELFSNFAIDVASNEEEVKFVNEQLSDISSYEELSKVIFRIGAVKKTKKIAQNEAIINFLETILGIVQK